MAMIKRGRIQRDTAVGDGLVFVEGNQYSFRLEGHWKSELPPKVGMQVSAELGDDGQLIALYAISGQAVAAEKATQALSAAQGAAQEAAKAFVSSIQAQGFPDAAKGYAQKIGYVTIGAYVAVLLGWFFLPFVSARIPMMGKMSVTFYEGLKFLNADGLQGMAVLSGGGSAGVYGLLVFCALAGVFASVFWKDRKALLGPALPLTYMLLLFIIGYAKASSALDTAQGASGFGETANNPQVRQMMEKATQAAKKEVMDAISIGLGAYLSVFGAIVLAWKGVIGFLSGAGGLSAPASFIPSPQPQPAQRAPAPTPIPAATASAVSMTCPQCKSAVGGNDPFCGECGYRLKA
jgi:hypothetical protein